MSLSKLKMCTITTIILISKNYNLNKSIIKGESESE